MLLFHNIDCSVGKEEAIAALSAFRGEQCACTAWHVWLIHPEGRVPGAIPQKFGICSLDSERLRVVSEQAPLGFDLLSTTEGGRILTVSLHPADADNMQPTTG